MKPLFNTGVVALVTIGALAAAAPAEAQTRYISCSVQTVFRKPAGHGTDWVHVENKYVKIFKIDDKTRMVSAWNNRNLKWTPMCGIANSACEVSWAADRIAIDGTKAPNTPVSPYLDFRRSLVLSNDGGTVSYVIADYGQTNGGPPNMTWTYDGSCMPSVAPSMKPAFGGPRHMNPLYQRATGPAKPVSKAEAAKVLAGYIGNTMTGYSGGGHWFHMWFLHEDPLIAYTSDDEDMSSEGKPRTWWVGKDSTGYRICPTADVANDTGQKMVPGVNCYPLLVKKVGDVWVEHDMDGDAYFTLLPGRQ